MEIENKKLSPVAISPSPEWLARRAEQMKNVGIVRGEMRGRGIEMVKSVAMAERLPELRTPKPDAKGEIASGWEFGGW